MALKTILETTQIVNTIETTEILDSIGLKGANGFSVQAVIDVNTAAAKDFNSSTLSSKAIQDLTYMAKNPEYAGPDGDDISITYIDPGTYDEALAVSVSDEDITVSLGSDHGTESSLVNQSLTYTALIPGVIGDDISIKLTDPGAASAVLDVSVSGKDIDVSLATDAEVKSSLINQNLNYYSLLTGIAGDDISIEAVDPALAGQSIDVTVASKAISVSLATSPEVKSTLINQGLTYTALGVGVLGNDVSVELIDPAGEGESLDVTVAASAISVSLATRAEADATLVNQSLTYTSVTADKEDGNDVTIEYEDPGVSGASLAVANVAEVITVTLATLADTYASKVIQDLTYTAAAAQLGHGNTISIEYTGDGTAGAETFTVTDHHVEVHMDDTPVTGSSATQIRTAWNLSGPASALAACAGTSANVQNDTSIIFLANEVVGGAITSTGNDVKAIVNADSPGAADYVLVSGTNAGVVAAFGPTNLAGGENGGEIISTASEIKTAVNNDIEANLLVAVTGSGASPVVIMGHTHLANGNDGGVITSSRDNVRLAINLDAEAKLLVTVTGSDPALITAFGPTSLAGGYDGGVITSTGNDVKAAVNADNDAKLLVLVSGTNASPVVELAKTPLASGADYTLISDADAVKVAIDGGDAADLVTVIVSGSGSDLQIPAVKVNLAGGADGDVDIDTDEMAISSHLMETGLKVRLTTTGTLPSGLSTGVDYFIIAIDANTIQLASSLARALAGTPIDLLDYGASEAVNTVTPSALAGATISIQKSNNDEDYSDVATPTAIAADGTVWFEVLNPTYKFFRIKYVLTAGSLSAENYIRVIGDKL
jgi:hypothetical protein